MATTVQEVTNYILKTPLNTNKAILNAMLTDLAENGEDGGRPVQLRRDNDYNYEKIGNTFIPANGEVCLVDTAKNGLRAKCGDGVTVWNDLEYIDEYIVQGYFFDGRFYRDSALSKEIHAQDHKLYVDIVERVSYVFDGNQLVPIGGASVIKPDGTSDYTTATDLRAGTMKLYQSLGQNSDGTMSQKAIYDELDDKVELTLNASEELLIFTM